MKENQKGNECMELNKELLVNLTEVNGIAGNETQVRELFKKETESYVDEFVQDGLGGSSVNIPEMQKDLKS